MIKYAKILNEETKECSVGIGTDTEYYESIGMSEMDVEEAYNGSWYLKGYCPEKPEPTYDEISELRKEYRREHIDDKTAERSRKTANGSWTQEDEQEYLALDAEVTAWIEENLPYPEET
jgi:hypothetical protein